MKKGRVLGFLLAAVLCFSIVPSKVALAEGSYITVDGKGATQSSAIEALSGQSYYRTSNSTWRAIWNEVTLEDDGYISVYAATGRYYAGITIYDANTHELYSTTFSDDGLRLHRGLEAGTYYVKFTTEYRYDSLFYNFVIHSGVSGELEPNDSFSTATPIQVNQKYLCARSNKGSDEDYYSINLRAGSTYRIIIDGYEEIGSPTFKLYESDRATNKYISSSWGNLKYDGSLDAYVYEFECEATDTYYIYADLYGSTNSSTFVLQVQEEPKPLASDSATLSSWVYVYDGHEKKPLVSVMHNDVELVEGVDYTVSYSNNVEIGTATATITGIGGFSGTVELDYEIVPSVTRLSESAYQTAAGTSAVISSTAFDASGWVVIARDDDFADAMSATGLAGALDAPIILTDRYGLSEAAYDEIRRLGATSAYVIGGRGAMPGDFEGELSNLGLTSVERVYGNESWDTSVECAKRIVEHGGNAEDSIVAMSLSFQDALSISSFAYKYEVPIYLQTQSGDRPLPDAAIEMIERAGGAIYVPGGPGAVRESTVEGVFGEDRVTRIYGWDGYDTSNQIATYMVESGLLSADVVTIACGAEAAKGSDALSGAALAGKKGGVILLANANERMEPARLATIEGSDSQGATAFLSAYDDEISQTYVLGGTYVMPDSLLEKAFEVLS